MELGLTYQPFNALRISVSPEYGRNINKLQYVTNENDIDRTHYINGTMDQRTLSMSLRLNYTINPNLTIQFWGQPFISRGTYSSFKEVINPMARSFDNRILEYDNNQISLVNDTYNVDLDLDSVSDFSFDNPDFSFVQFRSNLVLRWEYTPGSEVFLVWSQDISQSGNPQSELLTSLSDNIFNGEKPQNIFLVKATYRFMR